ncbi:MAG: DUF4097 family beta strand repeat-containing protein [Gemmatimonadaceae bacterium]
MIRRISKDSRIILFALGALLCATSAHAQKAFSRGWALHADGAVKIFNDVGSIRVIGWDLDSVAISGTISPTGTLFGGGTPEGVKMGIETASGVPKPSDIVIYVPARSRVWVRSASASIEVSAFSGALDASTVSGAVRIEGSPAELRAESMNGTLDVTASPAYLRLKSATGGITWTGSSDDVDITTVSGRVVVNGGAVHRARVESIDGEIRFGGSVAANGSLSIDTHSGNVTLALVKGTSATLEVSARGCDFFGMKQGQIPSSIVSGTPKSFYKSVGKPSPGGQSIVVRSYKGYVTAVMQ